VDFDISGAEHSGFATTVVVVVVVPQIEGVMLPWHLEITLSYAFNICCLIKIFEIETLLTNMLLNLQVVP
jgi:hypothetical protein